MPESLGVEKDVGLYIATHSQPITFSKQEKVNEEILIPIQAGAKLSDKEICTVRDDLGENISEKNRTFCELTTLYWIWKNDHHKIKGLSHYRRRFIISENEIKKRLTEYDLILPPPYYFRMSLEKEYQKYHVLEDLEKAVQVAVNLNPEMKMTFDYILGENQILPFNMWIAKQHIWDSYCEWLFPILFQLENEIDITNRESYQQRVFGFLSERLFTAYVHQHNLKYFVAPTEIPETEHILNKIKYKCGLKVNQLVFSWRKLYGTD